MEIEMYDFTGEGEIKGLTSGEMTFGIGCEAMWPNDPSSATASLGDSNAKPDAPEPFAGAPWLDRRFLVQAKDMIPLSKLNFDTHECYTLSFPNNPTGMGCISQENIYHYLSQQNDLSGYQLTSTYESYHIFRRDNSWFAEKFRQESKPCLPRRNLCLNPP